MGSPYVTIGEAAALLGVSRQKLGRMVRDGVLSARPSRLDARERLIPRHEVEGILRDEGRLADVSLEVESATR
jgi:excisionase family DNA binding protein